MTAATTALAVLESRHLGLIEWQPDSELYLPVGLPGFESERRLLAVEIPAQRPLVFLQSVELDDICFVTLPVNVLNVPFALRLSEEDRQALLLDEDSSMEHGHDVLCLALLLPAGNAFMVNLDAPVVIHLRNSRCVQSVSGTCENGRYVLSPSGWARSC